MATRKLVFNNSSEKNISQFQLFSGEKNKNNKENDNKMLENNNKLSTIQSE